MKVLFVCTGNTCRSPMAEAILRDEAKKRGLNVQVASAGIYAVDGQKASQGARAAMKSRGGLPEHRSSFLDDRTMEWADLVLTMTRAHRRSLLARYPEMEHKIHILCQFAAGEDKDVEDPFGGPVEMYEIVRIQLEDAIDRLIDKIE